MISFLASHDLDSDSLYKLDRAVWLARVVVQLWDSDHWLEGSRTQGGALLKREGENLAGCRCQCLGNTSATLLRVPGTNGTMVQLSGVMHSSPHDDTQGRLCLQTVLPFNYTCLEEEEGAFGKRLGGTCKMHTHQLAL